MRAPDQIRSEIEGTRSDMAETLRELGERFDPSEVRSAVKQDINQAVTRAKESVRAATLGRVEDIATRAGDLMNDTRQTLTQTIRDNPLPAALAGVGLAWLLMNRSSRQRIQVEPRGSVRERAQSTMGDVRERAQSTMSDVRERAQSTMGDVRERAEEIAAGARERIGGALETMSEDVPRQARIAERRVEHVFEDNPLAFGAAAVAIGALVGLTLPRTEREDAVLGEARDRLLQGARDVTEKAASEITH